MDSHNVKIIHRLFRALEDGEPEALAELYRPAVVQIEFPNRMAPRGASRNLEQMKEAMVRGRQVVRSQRYEILRLFEVGTTAIVEVRWSAELASPPPGAPSSLAASFAVFFEFSQGKIAVQRNYDCFDPP
jgi:ketosteroid isomerase-like protein